jgi:hypothetical protein
MIRVDNESVERVMGAVVGARSAEVIFTCRPRNGT